MEENDRINGYISSQIDVKTKYTLTWYKLSVFAKQKVKDSPFWKKTKYKTLDIIKDASGAVSSSTLLAIMGPSGAGKTTLLATISCRLKDMIYGEIRLNGQLISTDLMKKISGFLPQHDLTFEHLTVLEHLYFMAAMKMDERLEKADRLRKIYSLMNSLNLRNCSSSLLKDLSGGEKKRVSLAAQMLTDPVLMFCDEPTTGLDSYSAQNVVKTLKQLSRSGQIVVCTIHQPASHIFEMFDEVLIVSQGRTAYQGPTVDAADYFSRLNMKCPKNYNIAEFLVSKVSSNSPEGSRRVEMLCGMFEYSENGRKIEQRIKSTYTATIKKEKEIFVEFFKIKRATVWTQFCLLLHRRVVESLRNRKGHVINFTGSMIMGITFAILYWNYSIKDQRGIQDVQGLIFLLMAEVIFQYAYHVINFEDERSILFREVNDQLYSIGPYFLSQLTTKVTYGCIEPIIYASFVYFFTDIFKNIPFILYSMAFSLATVMAISYGTCFSFVFDSVETLTSWMVNYEAVSYITGGVIININTLPLIFQYAKYVSIFYYCIECLSILEWNSVDYIPCDNKCKKNCIITGKDALRMYGYKTEGFITDAGAILILIFIFNVVAYGVLWKRSKEQPVY